MGGSFLGAVEDVGGGDANAGGVGGGEGGNGSREGKGANDAEGNVGSQRRLAKERCIGWDGERAGLDGFERNRPVSALCEEAKKSDGCGGFPDGGVGAEDEDAGAWRGGGLGGWRWRWGEGAGWSWGGGWESGQGTGEGLDLMGSMEGGESYSKASRALPDGWRADGLYKKAVGAKANGGLDSVSVVAYREGEDWGANRIRGEVEGSSKLMGVGEEACTEKVAWGRGD
jgi:hypothetical protein